MRIFKLTGTKLFLIGSLLLLVSQTIAQDFSAGINVETPNPNAVLHLVSPNGDQGLLIPRITTVQRNAMTLDADDTGLMVFDDEDSRFYFWDGTVWIVINVGSSNGITAVASNGTLVGDGNVGTELAVNVGTGPDQIVQLDGTGALPALDGSALTGIAVAETDPTVPANLKDGVDFSELTGVPTDLADGDDSGLTSVDTDGTMSGDGNPATPLSVNVGTGANQIVQLDAGGALPAVDGSALTGVTPTIGANTITMTELAADAVTTNEIDDGTITDVDINDVAFGKLTGVPAGLADGDDGITAVTSDGTLT
ncbi:MAG: hypothetical protein AAGA66_01650, partial [Bacteroidota bacterium]